MAVVGFAGQLERFLSNPSVSVESESGAIIELYKAGGEAVVGFAGRLERSLSNLSVSVESESGAIIEL